MQRLITAILNFCNTLVHVSVFRRFYLFIDSFILSFGTEREIKSIGRGRGRQKEK